MKSSDIPDWALIRAYDRSYAYPGSDRDDAYKRAAVLWTCTGIELARMIAKHEQPPVDPDEVVVNAILSAFHNNNRTVEDRKWDRLGGNRFDRAVKRYKELKETKNES